MHVHRIVVLAAGVFSTPIVFKEKRGFLDLLEGDVSPEPTMTVAKPAMAPIEFDNEVEELVTTVQHHQETKTTLVTVLQHAVSTATPSSSWVTSLSHTPPDSTKTTTSAKGGNAGGGSASVSAPATSSSVKLVSAANSDVSATPPGELAQWKVIGISIICVTFVAIIIMAVTFFETWTAFVRDVVGCGGCRKGRDNGVEDLAPDWDRRTWEFKLANEDGHRYPTLTSVDSMAKV